MFWERALLSPNSGTFTVWVLFYKQLLHINVNAKVCKWVCLYVCVCLLLLHTKTTQWIWMNFEMDNFKLHIKKGFFKIGNEPD